MRNWMVLQRWPIAALLLGLGVSAVLFAWITLNLVDVALANVRLIRQYGVMALLDGGLRQLLEILLQACISLCLFLIFKGCETEIVQRWRSLHTPDKTGKTEL
jgi:putative effector of murein hydrolase LrgA (UPF0299 family)